MVRFHPFKAVWPSADLGDQAAAETDSNGSDAESEEVCSGSPGCTCFPCNSGPVVAIAPEPAFCAANGICLKAAKKMISDGTLELGEREGFVIYAQTMSSGHTQVGICGVVSVSDFRRGLIRRHENCIKEITDPGAPKPSVRQASNVDPVMLMYRESQAINELVKHFTERAAPDIEYSEISDSDDDNNYYFSQSTAAANAKAKAAAFSNSNSNSNVNVNNNSNGVASDASNSSAAPLQLPQLLRTSGRSLVYDTLPVPPPPRQPHAEADGACAEHSPSSASSSSSSPSANTSTSTSIGSDTDGDCEAPQQRQETAEQARCNLSTHRMWFIDAADDVKALRKVFHSNVSLLYIADGHHRSADACRRAHMHPKNTYGYALTVAYPDAHMRILPYNRCITTIGQLSTPRFLQFVSENFDVRAVEEGEDPQPTQQHEFGMYIDEQWFKLRPRNFDQLVANADVVHSPEERAELEAERAAQAAAAAAAAVAATSESLSSGDTAGQGIPPHPSTIDPVNSLDAQLLFNYLLQPILGIACVRTDKRVYYMRGNLGIKGLEVEVKAGRARVAFCLAPITAADIMQVADAGLLLPPKTSWFDPKPLSGLITRLH